MSAVLEVYELLRKAHQDIKGMHRTGLYGRVFAELQNAIDAVDSVLYLAEGEAVRADQRRNAQ